MKLKPFLFIISLFIFTQSLAQSSTVDINEKAYNEYVLSDKKMVKAYQKVLKGFEDYDLDGAAKKALKASQEAFLIYRNKEGKLQDKIYYGGSMLPTFKFRALKKLTDDRTKQLQYYESNG